jgi:hypothetical protein
LKQKNKEIEQYRLTVDKNLGNPFLTSDESYGNNGIFIIPYKNIKLCCVISSGSDWDHVSTHVECVKKKRCPFWDEMCFVKNLFWNEDETVIQFHPKKSDYVNCHPYTLHLWKSQIVDYVLPPKIFV